jgi:hypothetical protein
MDMKSDKFNFEDLKKEWKEQESSVPIPDDLNKIKKAQTPIDKIRKNIKTEMFLMIISVIFLMIVPFISIYQISGISELVYYIVLFLLIISAVPYYKSFYSYYKNTNHKTFNSYRSISEIYYELKNTIRLYKTINYLLVPYGFILFFIVLSKGRSEKIFEIIMNLPDSFTHENYGYFAALMLVILFTILAIFLVGIWVSMFYGKHLKELEKILQQFEEENE